MPREFRAPKLNRIVHIRNTRNRPSAARDRYGTLQPLPEYGVEVWCARFDLAPRTSIEEATLVQVLRSAFTIRWRPDIASASDLEIVDSTIIFASIGPPLERGRSGHSASHLEIVCERRA